MTKICDLPINDIQKKILSLIAAKESNITPYEICAKIKKSYSSVNQNIGILHAMGYVIKNKSMTGKLYYSTSKEVNL